MKTTIEIPDSIYRAAKVRAIERRQTLRDLVITSLERELSSPSTAEEPAGTYWANRQLRSGYAAALKAGAFRGGTDSTTVISEDRSSREDALL